MKYKSITARKKGDKKKMTKVQHNKMMEHSDNMPIKVQSPKYKKIVVKKKK